MFYELKPFGVLTPIVQILLIAGLFIWTTLWQYSEYKKTGKLWWDYPVLPSILFAPIYEELIFRGLILFYLAALYSPITAIVISSLLFGIWHLKNIFFLSKKRLVHQILYTALIFGPITAIIALWSGTIWLGVILHYMNNLYPQFKKINKDPKNKSQL